LESITDSPFRLNGISNTGWIVGNAWFYGDPGGDALVGIGPYARRDAGTPWVAGFPDLAELLPPDMLYYSGASEIIAIDNRNQLRFANGYAIVLHSGTLRPVDCLASSIGRRVKGFEGIPVAMLQ
jgi:hypothetical protein